MRPLSAELRLLGEPSKSKTVETETSPLRHLDIIISSGLQ